jgi:hypothetical protein
MFNFINKQFIFRQSGGEIWGFFHDDKQNLCLRTMSARGAWNNPIVLHRNVCRGFYADMDQDNVYHLLFQDNNGSIHYSRFDGQSVKTVLVLKSKIPSAYDKQLYIAPLKNNVHLFYVLQHDNSFMLAYQVFGNTGMETPKVVDYVSGNSLPYSIVYDPDDNLYAFYQSYDGKYLQLGYKKFNTTSRHWSDFTPVTKYPGNCEYPHAIIDTGGTIHLCYQRRSPRLFEMVYQQKAPGRNLWSPETIIHSSVHSFENASILQIRDKIVIYWVRDDVIYFSSRPYSGGDWCRPSRYGTQFGRQLQCLCYKSNSPRDRWHDERVKPGGRISLAPGIFPGSTAYGLKLAFVNADAIGDVLRDTLGDALGNIPGDVSPLSPLLFSKGNSEADSAASLRSDTRSILQDAFRQMQGSIAEIREGLSGVKKEISGLTNGYIELIKEINKFGIRLNMIENQLKQAKKSGSPVKTTAHINKNEMAEPWEDQKTGVESGTDQYEDETTESKAIASYKTADEPSAPAESSGKKKTSKQERDAKPSGQQHLSVDPDKIKEWEEWKGPKEWQETD